MPARIKCSANYQNGRLAMLEAKTNGYEGALLLNSRGKLSEAPGACCFMVRGGTPVTTPVTADILESVTRGTLLELFRTELGQTPVERDIDRTELYVAEEIFLCGSGWEITPIVSLDRIPLGDGKEPGPQAKQRLTELRRLIDSLAAVIDPTFLGQWLLTPNAAFGALKPLEVIERGETDRLWRMLFYLEAGLPA